MITTANMPSEQKTYSRTAEYRKICKPLVERKRRARINKSLSELKSIILEVVKKDGCQYSKLEKADILEMTVGHLHQLRRQKQQQEVVDDGVDKFQAGFVQCAADVSRFLYRQAEESPIMKSDDAALRSRLLGHLNGCIGRLSTASNSIKSPSPNVYSPPISPDQYTPPTSPTVPSTKCAITSIKQMPQVITTSESASLWRPW